MRRVITIAFALLLKTFLEVNDILGGPQGMQVPGMKILGWSFNNNIEIAGLTLSFYMNYFVVALLLLIARVCPGAAGWSAHGSVSTSMRCGSTRPRRPASASISCAGR